MPNRLVDSFASLRASGRRGLMPFVTAGDPTLADLPAVLEAVEAAGATAVEVGFPFSDPVADGPVIAASMQHALRGGTTVRGVLAAVAEAREDAGVTIPLIGMLSYSIVYRLGLDAFCRDAAAAGLDGLILPDLGLEETGPARAAAAAAGLTLSLLVAPSTPPMRAAALAEASTGFLYVVSRAGITGADARMGEGLEERVAQLRAATELPLAVGFGVSGPEQVAQVVSVADAAIVGSALIRGLEGFRGDGHAAAAEAAGAFVARLAGGLPAPVPA